MAGLNDDEQLALARRLKARCLELLAQAHEDAGVQGLCAEGRWEAALGALERADPRELLSPAAPAPDAGASPAAHGAASPAPRSSQ
jgi:hypothetical protein